MPNKVHIRGLDTLSTEDVKAFVEDHFGRVNKVEWIDDESANLVFQSEDAAQDALRALSAQSEAAAQASAGETVPAKDIPSKPEVNLQIRIALQSDKKAPGAATRSRYYLFHPDQDPEERRRREGRRRYRERDDNGYRGRDSYARGRRDSDEIEAFDASLYDDDEATLASRAAKSRTQQRRSRSRGSASGLSGSRRTNAKKELFPNRSSLGNKGSTRNRSASPLRDLLDSRPVVLHDADSGTLSNRATASGIRHKLAEERAAKELFPSRIQTVGEGHMDRVGMTERTSRLSFDDDASKAPDLLSIKGAAERKGRDAGFAIKGAAGASVKELFPDRFGTNEGKELFVNRPGGRGRQRQKAEDLFL